MRTIMVKLERGYFERLLEESKITKSELVKILGLQYQSLNKWLNSDSYPSYIETLIKWIGLSKKYGNMEDMGKQITESDNIKIREEIIKLEEENKELKKELELLISMRDIIKYKRERMKNI